jgi:hypothetical protein
MTMRLLSALLLVSVAAAPAAVQGPLGPPQRVRVVDEAGAPVAGAEVQMLGGPPWAESVERSASTDQEGWASFANGEKRYYKARATDPVRRFVGRGDIPENFAHSVERPLILKISELWVGGIVVPGQKIIQSYCMSAESFAGIHAADEIPHELLRRWPGAVWLGAYHGADGASGPESLEMEIDVYGFAPAAIRVPMLRVSRFAEPHTLDATTFVPMPWVTLPVVLRDPDGTPLPAEHLRAVRSMATLRRVIPPGEELRHRFYRLTADPNESWPIALPCGRYLVKLTGVISLGSGALKWQSEVGSLDVATDTESIDVTLPVTLRKQRVHVRPTGRGPFSFGVRAKHDSGFEAHGHRDESGYVEFVLPPGRNELTLELSGPNGEFWRFQRSVDVGAATNADVEWVLPNS